MRKHVERELKLVPGEGFRLSDLGEPMPPRVFVSTYHDTSDLRLARHGITLRHRAEEGTRLWQLKIPSGAARIELEVPGTPAHPPAEMTDLLVSLLRGEPLVKIARLRTRRQGVRKDGAEIVEDSVAVYEAQRVTRRFREVEVELLDGDERTLQRLSARCAGRARSRGFSRPSSTARSTSRSTASRAGSPRTRRRELRSGSPLSSSTVACSTTTQARAWVRIRRTSTRCVWRLVEHGPSCGQRDRSSNPRGPRSSAPLGWLGSALGPARDADVLLEHLRAEVEGLGERAEPAQGLVVALEEQRERALAEAVGALSEQRYFELLDRIERAEHPPRAGEPATTLADLWWKECKRTRRAFAKLDRRSPDEELHAARIRVKRSRYAAELAAHELGEPGARFVAAAKKLQDILGEHQDAAVAEAWILDWGKSNQSADDVLQLLVERERKRRKRARHAWPEAWERLEQRAHETRA